MIERINALKNKATERANYYSQLDFVIIAEEFSTFANILDEAAHTIETLAKERDHFENQMMLLEDKLNMCDEKIREEVENEEI